MILLLPLYLIPLLSILLPISLAATPTSFCKCTCFTNSTIIALDTPTKPSSISSRDLNFPQNTYSSLETLDFDARDVEMRIRADALAGGDNKKVRAKTCNDCNRKFCLEYNLPICKGAKEEDVFTTCFQRDSRKDEAVVFIFIFATAGLLGWSLIKPWVEKWIERARERRSYLPVSTAPEGS